MSTPRIVVSASAKINLCLGVGPSRADGFHSLATVYQAIGRYDHVTVSRADGLAVSVRGERGVRVDDVPEGRENIAARAAVLLAAHHGIDPDVRIDIEKGIPVAGGMAGGSADAAASLLACDHLWQLETPREDLLGLAALLGSDVPFALVGGTAIGSGRGEVVTPLMTRGEYWWVVLEAPVGLSTPAVYAAFDEDHEGAGLLDPEIPDELIHALMREDIEALGGALSNDLQAAALRLRPELTEALAQGVAESAHGAILSGSGPTCLFLCGSRTHAQQVASGLERAGLGALSLAPGPVPGARVVAADR